jgi:hypothetical protein
MPSTSPITQEQLAEHAGAYFAYATVEEVPEKLWLDCYVPANQWYIRAVFSSGLSTISLVRLAALAVALSERYKVELVPVAYAENCDWEELEARNAALNEVW